jgi:hypothetical protein
MKSSLSATANEARGLAKMVGAIAGGLSLQQSISGALNLQHEYRNLANQINRLGDSGKDWQDVQLTIEDSVKASGQKAEDMVVVFRELYTATGDLKYTEEAVRAIGIAATDSGESAIALATPMQLAARKFGVAAQDTEEAVARIIEKVGVGGASLDGMNNRFAIMAGEAAEAGMKGKEGLSALLGVMLTLDSRIGEKAAPGLRMLFQTLKDGTTQMRAISKQSGMKFDVDTSAFEKLRKLIGSEKGRKTAELVFTADSRVVYDTLVAPFEQAFKLAKAQGKNTTEATAAGMSAYDAAMARLTESTADFSKAAAGSAKRMIEDPTVILRKATSEMALAFTDKRMLDSLTQLAKITPRVASGMSDMVRYTIENPLKAAGMYMGARAGAAGVIKFTGELGAAGLKAAGSSIATMFATQVAKDGAWTVAGKAFGIAGGAAAAFMVGKAIIDAMSASDEAKNARAESVAAIGSAVAASGTKEQRAAYLSRAKQELERVKAEGPSASEKVFGTLEAVTGGTSILERSGRQKLELETTVAALERSLNTTSVEQATRATIESFQRMTQAADKVSRAMGGVGAGGSNGLPPRAPTKEGY